MRKPVPVFGHRCVGPVIIADIPMPPDSGVLSPAWGRYLETVKSALHPSKPTGYVDMIISVMMVDAFEVVSVRHLQSAVLNAVCPAWCLDEDTITALTVVRRHETEGRQSWVQVHVGTTGALTHITSGDKKTPVHGYLWIGN